MASFDVAKSFSILVYFVLGYVKEIYLQKISQEKEELVELLCLIKIPP